MCVCVGTRKSNNKICHTTINNHRINSNNTRTILLLMMRDALMNCAYGGCGDGDHHRRRRRRRPNSIKTKYRTLQYWTDCFHLSHLNARALSQVQSVLFLFQT